MRSWIFRLLAILNPDSDPVKSGTTIPLVGIMIPLYPDPESDFKPFVDYGTGFGSSKKWNHNTFSLYYNGLGIPALDYNYVLMLNNQAWDL